MGRGFAIPLEGFLIQGSGMSKLCVIWFLVGLLCLPEAMGSPAEAARIQKDYEQRMAEWSLKLQAAATPEARGLAWDSRPDAVATVDALWRVLEPALAEEWTISPAAWFLRMAPTLTRPNEAGGMVPAFTKEIEAVRKALETHHLASKQLAPMCMALVANADPRSLALLEKIQGSHPDKKVQGVAALGAAMLLKSLGDEEDLMKKRLTYLRKAIIESDDVELDNTTVAKLAEDELYIIRYLSKGREAPDLNGANTGGKLMKLSDYKGKVVVLLFWSAGMSDAARVLESSRAMQAKHSGKPFMLVGVNGDATEQLRKLEMEENTLVTWPNFSDPQAKLMGEYRVGSLPLVYVLDGSRKIHYVGAPGAFVELAVEALLEGTPAISE